MRAPQFASVSHAVAIVVVVVILTVFAVLLVFAALWCLFCRLGLAFALALELVAAQNFRHSLFGGVFVLKNKKSLCHLVEVRVIIVNDSLCIFLSVDGPGHKFQMEFFETWRDAQGDFASFVVHTIRAANSGAACFASGAALRRRLSASFFGGRVHFWQVQLFCGVFHTVFDLGFGWSEESNQSTPEGNHVTGEARENACIDDGDFQQVLKNTDVLADCASVYVAIALALVLNVRALHLCRVEGIHFWTIDFFHSTPFLNPALLFSFHIMEISNVEHILFVTPSTHQNVSPLYPLDFTT